MSDLTDAPLISVGLDVGSLNARVCISNGEYSPTAKPPSIVPNEIGQRYTLALSTPEPEVETDPMNDQYWDNGKNKNNNNNKNKAVKKAVHYLYGDAARRSLQRLKKPLGPHSILTMLQLDQQDNENGDDDDDNDAQAACASFFHHLTNLTTNATHTTPQSLRFVLSVPPFTDSRHIANLSSSLHKGVIQSIQEVGGYHKRLKNNIHGQTRTLTILTHPLAIAHAHGIFHSPTTPTSKPPTILIVDWGASALSLTCLSITSSPHGMARIVHHTTHPSLGGTTILQLLVKHIAELFERKVRGAIPPGETLCNKKARAKLEVAAEDALRSFGFSPKVTVTVDGLIDGIDCHVDVMLARFEMLLGSTLRSAEGKLKEVAGKYKLDQVIGAGNIMKMTSVEKMMDRLFPRGDMCRGKSVNDVPPEEAVAMGCAAFGSMCLASDFVNGHGHGHDEENGNEAKMTQETEQDVQDSIHGIEEEVPLCPIGIGLSLQEDDPAAIMMIDKMVPLPALVTKTVDCTGCTSNSIGIIQVGENDVEKVVGRIEGFTPDDLKEVEVTMELTSEGKLSVSLNGGPVFEV